MLRLLTFLIVITFYVTFASAVESHQYCVIGAGPAGLQMAHLLQDAGRDYIVFERNSKAGSTFINLPRQRHLISANKIYTGYKNIEFNWRHDWNSLFSDDESLVMGRYSNEYFPHADDLVRYFNDYANKLKLQIKYNTSVKDISSIEVDNDSRKIFEMSDSNGNLYRCNITIVSTGISIPNIPDAVGIENAIGYESASTNVSDYKGKNILILGQGNSAFEMAKLASPVANHVHMVSRLGIRQSWSSHYVGDVRGINRDFIDGMQLKFMDGVAYSEMKNLIFKKGANNKTIIKLRDPISRKVTGKAVNNNILRKDYDIVIRCLGFQFDDSIFNESATPLRGSENLGKYPLIAESYGSINVPDMYFAGSLAHIIDFRKSSGGFIHGFRYSARALHQILEWKYHGNRWPSTTHTTDGLLYKILKRINEASALYQMFGVFADVVILDEDGSHQYIEDVPIQLIPKLEEFTGIPLKKKLLAMTFEYGKKFTGPRTDTLAPNRVNTDWKKAYKCNFIHPKIYYYDEPPIGLGRDGKLPTPTKVHHVVEDFLTHWERLENHILPLKTFIEDVFQSDFNNYYGDSCYELMMTMKSAPMGCNQGQFIDRPIQFYLTI